MLMKSDPTTTNSSATRSVPVACAHCGMEERRLLHQVRHRGIFRRLCTTCVLRLHPQSFCPTCFQVYPPPPSNDAVVTCFKCYSSSHSHCVETGPTSSSTPYICPLCLHPNTPIFRLRAATEANVEISAAMNVRIEDCRVMDRDDAKKFLAAARIASASMNKAAVASIAEAERRAKEAAFTRKRARESLDHISHLASKEKSRKKEAVLAGPGLRGIGNNGGCIGPAVEVERETNVSVSNSNRNGSAAGGSCLVTVVEEKINNAGNVDRDNSSQVLAALNAVELRENEKMGSEIMEQGEGRGVSQIDDHALMDVDEKARMSLGAGENVGGLVGERSNDSSSDRVNFTDMETGAANLITQGEKLEEVNNEVVFVQPVAHQMQYKENRNDEEQHANGGLL